MPEPPTVLAISLEAAEPKLVRELIARGEMPELARVAERSAWLPVGPEVYIGSVPLWPSFTTGLGAERHRRTYGPWLWDPDQMRIAPENTAPLQPLWARSGIESIGLFDVPGAPAESPYPGFIVRGWGTHNPMDLTYSVWPAEAAPLVGERHPFECATEINHTTGDRVKELRRLGDDAMRGLRLRGDAAQRLLEQFRPQLAIVNFPELHRTGHWLWHTLDSGDPLYASLPEAVRSLPVGIKDLYRETDRQVGRLLAAAGPDSEVFVFALNGMEPAHGIPDFLRPLLISTGYARLAKLRPGSLGRRGLAAVKAAAPARLKRAYHAAMPRDLALRVAELLPDYDWSATRAFAMPSEQHGWIRLNVAGREAAGIVEPAEFEATGDELEALLRSLVSPSGEPLVRDVVRTGRDDALPDLVAHWTPAAHGEVARLGDEQFRAPRVLPWLVGQHTMEGFCLAPPRSVRANGTVRPTELQELLLAAARR
jgi:Type I phosphodiesterase / nucleotide pyrophosphatase